MKIRSALAVLVLVVSGCSGPADRSVAPSPTRDAPSTPVAPPPTPLWLDGIPTGPPPQVGHVVSGTYVAPDGSRVAVRRPGRPSRSPQVADFTVLADGSLLVQDDDNFEGYTGLRRVVRGRTVAQWSTTGFVTGPRGSAAFGEATTSEASVYGPIAVHLFRGRYHLVQKVAFHPSVLAVVGDRVVYRRRYGLPGKHPSLVTDLSNPPTRWRGPLPARHQVPRGPIPPRTVVLRSVREPSGSLLLLVAERSGDRDRTTALVRRLPDGVVEVAAPALPRPSHSRFATAYVLDRRG